MSIEGFDPELGPMVAIPEPFWERSLLTLFRWRPACYPCHQRFHTREQWERHWLTIHRAGVVATGDNHE